MTDYYFYPYIALTGGADGALDSLDGSLLKDGDGAFVIIPSTKKVYIYTLDEDSAGTDDGENIIAPDSNAGDKRWVLTNPASALASSITFTPAGTGAVATTVQDKLRDCVSGVDYGMTAGVGNDNKGAFDYAVTAALASNHHRLYIPSGTYYFDSKPADITDKIDIYGDGMLSTVLIRNYNEGSSKGFLHIVASGVQARSLCIEAASDTTGGRAICIVATSTEGCSQCVFEDLYLTTLGTDTWDYTVLIDGQAKVADAVGVRETCFRNCHIFGASSSAAYFYSVVGLSVTGGGLYTAGGTGTRSIYVAGNSGVESYYVNVNVNSIQGGVNLSRCNYVTINSPVIGGAIENDNQADNCLVISSSTGSVYANWTNSNVIP